MICRPNPSLGVPIYLQLMEQVKQVQPTVVVLGYGMASSLEDVEGRVTRVPDQIPAAVDPTGKNMGTRETRPSEVHGLNSRPIFGGSPFP